MNEWTTALKIGVVCVLAAGLISVSVVFVITGIFVEENVKDSVISAYDTSDELYKFDNVWLDKESAFNFACSCIGKSVSLKIDTAASGLEEISLDSPNVRKKIEDCIDRERFKVKIITVSDKITVFLDRG